MTKRLTYAIVTMLLAFIGLCPSWAQAEEFSGKILQVGSNATTLEEGKWYALFNGYSSSFVKEGNDNTLTVTTKNPNNGDAAANAGYLIKLE